MLTAAVRKTKRESELCMRGRKTSQLVKKFLRKLVNLEDKKGMGIRNVWTVVLDRDGLNAAWGFRLKGGKDVGGGTPLEVIKERPTEKQISIGSAAEGILEVGDRILGINHIDTKAISHSDAQEIFRRAGTSITLVIARPDHLDPSSFPHSEPMFASSHLQSTTPGQNISKRPQPYRTTQLVLPGARPYRYANGPPAAPTSGPTPLGPKLPGPKPVPILPPWGHRQEAARNVVEAIGYQPFRTTPLVLPGAKSTGAGNSSLAVVTHHAPVANGPTDQPFRTSPLVTPSPKTINDVKQNLSGKNLHTSPPLFSHNPSNMQNQPSGGAWGRQPPLPPTSGPNPTGSKTIEIDGVRKQVVTQQFNSPLNLYSDETIVDTVIANRGVGGGVSGQPQQGDHPGYVPSSKPHLPTPKDGTFSKPQPSATFKMILESEMGEAKDQQGIVGSEWSKPTNQSRPGSATSIRPASSMAPPDPVMLDQSISQSASFKRIMQSMVGESDY